jgi:hypothetical protein
MKTVEWANTDSRIEIDVNGKEVTVFVAYERDIYFTDEASVTLSVDQFNELMYKVREAIVDEQRKGKL